MHHQTDIYNAWCVVGQGNRVNEQKFNAKAPGRPRTAKMPCAHWHCRMLLVTISHPNRQSVFNLASWRSFFAPSRLGVVPLVIYPIALRRRVCR
jgi:hypothetical protein